MLLIARLQSHRSSWSCAEDPRCAIGLVRRLAANREGRLQGLLSRTAKFTGGGMCVVGEMTLRHRAATGNSMKLLSLAE
jgi:hypothetical protein